MLTRRLDGYISLSDAVREQALERFPALRELPGFVIPIGNFRGVYPARLTRRQARMSLRIADDALALLHLGQIRRYKNVPRLVAAFRAYADPTAVLLIAGKPHPASVADDVRKAAGNDPRVRTFLEFVPDADVQIYLRAADLAVLPYTDIANSGSAILSVSYDRPTLAPRKGAMPELQRLVGEDWLRLYEGELTTATIAEALDWACSPREGSPPLDRLDWGELARRTVDAYHRICQGAAVQALEPIRS
jgi:glycosyltransferase involved in cell wall biosynthesis